MNTKTILAWSIIISLGGFLFGLDTAVISGAEQSIQQLWNLDVFSHGFTVSIALIGTVIGAMLGGIPTDKLGRKKTLMWIAFLYLISAIGSALATDWYVFLFFRFIGGLGVGCSSVTAPMYISELAPASHRGRLVVMFQFNIVFGILIAYLSNYLLDGIGENSWRWMLGIEAFPAALFFGLVFLLPESPRWLVVKRNAPEEARKIFQRIDPLTADAELQAINTSHARLSSSGSSHLFSGKFNLPITLAVAMAFFNQVSGINAIIYYAPRILGMAGLGTKSALLSTAGLGLVNLIFTLLAINFIDRYGRRTLMLVGSVGLIITLSLVAYAFYTGSQGFFVPICLFVYIGFFAFSQGAVIWVFISEIFPTEVRASGQALGSFTHWFMAAAISFTFPYFAQSLLPGNTFALFAVMMVLQLIFVWRIMPETKGTSLEEVEEKLIE